MDKKRLRWKFVCWDMVAALLSWLLFMVLRRITNELYDFGFDVFVPYRRYYASFVLFPFLCLIVHFITGFYVETIRKTIIVEILRTFVSAFAISLLVFFVLVLDDVVINYSYYYNSLLGLFLLLGFVTSLFRFVIMLVTQNRFKNKLLTINTLIVGTGENARDTATQIGKHSIYYTNIGFVKMNGEQSVVSDSELLGNLFDVERIIRAKNVQQIIVALDAETSDKHLFETINYLIKYPVEVQFIPRLYELIVGKVRMSEYGIVPLVSLTEPTMSAWQRAVKRTLDILVALFALVFLSPLFVIVALAIRLDTKGSVFFKQKRIGLFGKPFMMYKFRTMSVNAENGSPKLSSPNDDRITAVGRFLRKYRLDELPQFYNILIGQMSLVGPRPERQYYIDKIVEIAPYYFAIYRIRPGLTSWGPIKVGYADTVEKMVKRLNYDVVYLENMSLLTDLKIILSTIEVIVKGKGV